MALGARWISERRAQRSGWRTTLRTDLRSASRSVPFGGTGPVREAIPEKTGRCIAESNQPAPGHLADQECAPHITKSLALVPRNNAQAQLQAVGSICGSPACAR